MLELTTKKLNVKIDGQVYELAPLRVYQVQELEKNKDNIGMDALIDVLSGAGLPVEVIKNLSADHLNQIVSLLTGKSKAS